MRIRRIALHNFRGVSDVEVVPAPNGVTLIEGPNEVGKSSLAEAIDMIFEHLDSSSKAAVKATKPVDVDEGTEVEVELTTGEYHVIYNKRWHKQQSTTLKVLAPTPENHTGRRAHDRMKEILAETLDEDLWRALRYQQGTSIAQAALGDSPSLAAALDVAASGSTFASDDELDLWERVTDERAKYFTSTGRPVMERTRLGEAVDEARARVQHIRGELSLLDEASESFRSTSRRLIDLEGQVLEHQRLVNELTQESRRLEKRRQEMDRLKTTVEVAAARASSARGVSDERQRLILDAKRARERLEELQSVSERAAPGMDAVQRRFLEAIELRDAALIGRQSAESVERIAAGDYEFFRELLDLELLRERQDRVVHAEEVRGNAEAFLESCRVDASLVSEMEQAFLEVTATRSRLAGDSVSVRVEALDDIDLIVSGAQFGLGTGQVFTGSLTSDLELLIPGVARVNLEGRAATAELANSADRADKRLQDLFESAGLSGEGALLQARELEYRRRSAEEDLERASRALVENLRDLTPQLMFDKIQRAEANTSHYRAARVSETPLPLNLEEAKVVSESAKVELERASRLHDQRQEDLVTIQQEVNALKADADRLGVTLELAGVDVATTQMILDSARLGKTDEEVEQDMETSARASFEAQSAYREAEMPELDVELERLENARAALDRLEEAYRYCEIELAKLGALLDSKGEGGLGDQLNDAKTALEHLERELTQWDRRAKAVQLLHSSFGARRDESRRARLAPFRDRIVSLGRIVFGPTFSVELNENLQISTRTLAGVTVPYEFLSSGAKEQLCIVSRLACAALVNPSSPDSTDTGVPVLIDDALGYSDPVRLERLGTVLGVAGRQSQVIVLTCTPDRYRHVGTATVIPLERRPRDVG